MILCIEVKHTTNLYSFSRAIQVKLNRREYMECQIETTLLIYHCTLKWI